MGLNQGSRDKIEKVRSPSKSRFSPDFEFNNQQMLKGWYDDVMEIQLD
jgi:hypothetical protein